MRQGARGRWLAAGALLLLAALVAVTLVRRALDVPPSWVVWQERTFEADVDGDGAPDELEIQGHVLHIRTAAGMVCTSPEGWQVQDAFVADIDRDGAPEVLTVVWQKGNYGTSRPFWVAPGEGDNEWSQHLFVHRLEGVTLDPVWMSSMLGFELAEASLDSDLQLHTVLTSGEELVWEWLSWGFVLVEE